MKIFCGKDFSCLSFSCDLKKVLSTFLLNIVRLYLTLSLFLASITNIPINTNF